MVVFGYVRQLFVEEECVQSNMVEPSMHILKSICTFYAQEALHFIGFDDGVTHYMIDVDSVL